MFLILTLFLGSAANLYVRNSFFLNSNEIVASPRQGVKNTLIVSGRYVHYSVFLVVSDKSICGLLILAAVSRGGCY